MTNFFLPLHLTDMTLFSEFYGSSPVIFRYCINVFFVTKNVLASICDRAVFTWLSKVIEELVWFWFYYALWLASVFTLVLVLRQSSENRSNMTESCQYHYWLWKCLKIVIVEWGSVWCPCIYCLKHFYTSITPKCTCMCVVLNLAELYDEEKDTNLVRENDGEMWVINKGCRLLCKKKSNMTKISIQILLFDQYITKNKLLYLRWICMVVKKWELQCA